MVHQKVVSLQPQKGTLPEWLGIGLQNRGRRFESARYLTSLLSFSRLFSCVEDTLSYLPHMQCGAETQPLLVLSVSETRYIVRSWLHTTGVSGIPADAGTQRVGDMLLCQVMAPRS